MSHWDEPVWAAIWIAKATKMIGVPRYSYHLDVAKAKYCENYYTELVADCFSDSEEEWWKINYEYMWLEVFSYSEKQPAIMALLASLTNKEYFLKKIFEWYEYLGGNDPFTETHPEFSNGGLLIYKNWGKYDGTHLGELGPLRYANNAAFISLLTAKLVDNPEQKQVYVKWAQQQVWYTLGDNPANYSFVIGFGTSYPRKPYHTGSSCPEYDTTCGCPWFYSPDNNPIELLGAVVGGPDFNDRYTDDRLNRVSSAVGIDHMVGFTSAVAALADLTRFGGRSDSNVLNMWS